MTPIEIGIIGIVVLIILLLIRVPAGISLLIAAALGNAMLTAPLPALTQLASDAVAITLRNSLAVIPFVLLTGILITKTSIPSALYDLMKFIFGSGKGGVGVASIGASAVSGAFCPDQNSMMKASLPDAISDMKKYGYDSGFSTSVATVGASLALIIPPSIPLIAFAFMAELSIGQMLLAGIVPGGFATILLMIAASFFIILRPNPAPAAAKTNRPSAIQALKLAWFVPFLFAAMFVLIYMGWATPTEAAAIGAALAFVFALLVKQMSLKILIDSLIQSAMLTGKTFILLIGAGLFSLFLTRSLITVSLVSFFSRLDIASVFIVLLFLVAFMFLGMIVDKLVAVVLLTPVTYPVILSLGLHGVWFGVLVILALMLSMFISPARFMRLVNRSIGADKQGGKIKTKKTETTTYPVAWTFIAVLLILIALVMAFPIIARFLPSMMFGR